MANTEYRYIEGSYAPTGEAAEIAQKYNPFRDPEPPDYLRYGRRIGNVADPAPRISWVGPDGDLIEVRGSVWVGQFALGAPTPADVPRRVRLGVIWGAMYKNSKGPARPK